MQGYNGSQLWDTAFAVQALVSSGLGPAISSTLQKAHCFIDVSQVSQLHTNVQQTAWGKGGGGGSCMAMSTALSTLQVTSDVPGPIGKWYRHVSKGAWPFSSRDHGWPISDCTAEGAVNSSFAVSAW